MSEPKRIQVVRPHQNINEYVYQRNQISQDNTYEQVLLNQKDYYTIGWRRLHAIQTLPLRENWPITMGNALSAFSSGLIGGLITRRMARNLSLHVTLSTLPSSAACFFVVTVSHLSAYYFQVLRPMFSDDPMTCSTCLEIRAFTIASVIPAAMGTSIAVLGNLSACLLNKTIRLPRFNIKAYPEWKQFFSRHAFKGMRQRYFVAYPLMSGFLTSMIFFGQNYYFRSTLQNRLDILDKQPVPPKEPKKRNTLFGPIQDFFTKLTGGKFR